MEGNVAHKKASEVVKRYFRAKPLADGIFWSACQLPIEDAVWMSVLVAQEEVKEVCNVRLGLGNRRRSGWTLRLYRHTCVLVWHGRVLGWLDDCCVLRGAVWVILLSRYRIYCTVLDRLCNIVLSFILINCVWLVFISWIWNYSFILGSLIFCFWAYWNCLILFNSLILLSLILINCLIIHLSLILFRYGLIINLWADWFCIIWVSLIRFIWACFILISLILLRWRIGGVLIKRCLVLYWKNRISLIWSSCLALQGLVLRSIRICWIWSI